MISWREFEAAAPTIAQHGQQRFEMTRVCLLGTLRKDGSPRISPVEPYLSGGELLFGAMAWSLKATDLLRDARCVLHSAITAPDNGEPEVKLYGRASEAPSEIADSCTQAWWQPQPTAAVIFMLHIERATLIEWDLVQSQMLVQRWSAADGLSKASRSYP
jgi:Pyridoxamine 5'-phosphate oxidase